MRLATRLGIAGVVVLAAALVACDKKPDGASSGATAAASASAVSSASESALVGEDLASEEDFEDEAEAQITDENYATELDKLEKELL